MFSGIRTEAAAVAERDPTWMVDQIGERVGTVLSAGQLEKWSTFPVTFETSMDLLASVGRKGQKLETKADYLDAFEEIETGLRAVR